MNTLPAVTVIKEMFDVIQKIYVAHVMIAPSNETDAYFDACRSQMYKELLKAQPLERLSHQEILNQFKHENGNKDFVFMFYGNVSNVWVTLFAKLTPQSINIEQIMQSDEIFIDSEGWIYNIRCPGIRLGIYRARGI